ncbi:MAG: hypothetical protein CMJ65_10580 [Planctomycetaceae bacterium]|nr:hypothetical protein [Planctomycetaceae bacterium]
MRRRVISCNDELVDRETGFMKAFTTRTRMLLGLAGIVALASLLTAIRAEGPLPSLAERLKTLSNRKWELPSLRGPGAPKKQESAPAPAPASAPARSARSSIVMEELRRFYHHNGLAMPDMTPVKVDQLTDDISANTVAGFKRVADDATRKAADAVAALNAAELARANSVSRIQSAQDRVDAAIKTRFAADVEILEQQKQFDNARAKGAAVTEAKIVAQRKNAEQQQKLRDIKTWAEATAKATIAAEQKLAEQKKKLAEQKKKLAEQKKKLDEATDTVDAANEVKAAAELEVVEQRRNSADAKTWVDAVALAELASEKELAEQKKELNAARAKGIAVNQEIRDADRMIVAARKAAAAATTKSADMKVIAQHAAKIATELTGRAAVAEKQAIAAAEARDRSAPALPAAPAARVQPVRHVETRGILVGLKGFCPVALCDQRKLIKARPEFEITHRGFVVLLSSPAARTAFLASPGKYLPAAGGQDVVSLGSQRPQPGSLDHATWHRGQLYLFASPENLATFTKQPDRYSR